MPKHQPVEGDLKPPEIIYKDEELLVVNKPSHLLVHLTKMSSDKTSLKCQLENNLGEGLYTVHRLDRQTSGLMMIARSSSSASLIQTLFTQNHVRKVYHCLVRGQFKESLVCDKPLTDENKIAKEARTHLRPLQVFPYASLVEASPSTGRRHQIRRHLSFLAHQIIGDTTHGKGRINQHYRDRYNLHRLFLHSTRLEFPHPTKGNLMVFDCPLPDDLQNVVTTLAEEQPG